MVDDLEVILSLPFVCFDVPKQLRVRDSRRSAFSLVDDVVGVGVAPAVCFVDHYSGDL